MVVLCFDVPLIIAIKMLPITLVCGLTSASLVAGLTREKLSMITSVKVTEASSDSGGKSCTHDNN